MPRLDVLLTNPPRAHSYEGLTSLSHCRKPFPGRILSIITSIVTRNIRDDEFRKEDQIAFYDCFHVQSLTNPRTETNNAQPAELPRPNETVPKGTHTAVLTLQ